MIRFGLASALLAFLSACVTQVPPPAPGDEGARRAPRLALPQGPRPRGAEEAKDAPSPLTPADQDKLAALKEVQADALFEALRVMKPSTSEAVTSRAVLTAAPVSFGGAGVVGEYRCRTLKHGGAIGFVVYGYFDCRVTEGPKSLIFEKTSGSQRMTGRLFAGPGADGRMGLAYAGTQHGAEDAGDTYPEGAAEVGLFERTGDKRYRLTIPEPGEEGLLDVLDLERVADPDED